jgi:hypothetical protein
MDHVIGEVQGNFIKLHGKFPDLKFLGGDALAVRLNDCDFVPEPIRSTVLGNVLRAVGVEKPIPILAAGELREIACAEKAQSHRQPWNK